MILLLPLPASGGGWGVSDLSDLSRTPPSVQISRGRRSAPTPGAAPSWVMMFQWASGYGTVVVVMGTLLQVDTTPPQPPGSKLELGGPRATPRGSPVAQDPAPGGRDKKGGAEQGPPAGVWVEGHPSGQASWMAPAAALETGTLESGDRRKEGQLTVPFQWGVTERLRVSSVARQSCPCGVESSARLLNALLRCL